MLRPSVYRSHFTATELGAIPAVQLGERVHTVEHPAFGCPVTGCAFVGPMQVYVNAVRWLCGHTRSLPAHDQSCYVACHHNRAKQLSAKHDKNLRDMAEARARRLTVVA